MGESIQRGSKVKMKKDNDMQVGIQNQKRSKKN